MLRFFSQKTRSLALVVAAVVIAGGAAAPNQPRAKPPTFSDADRAAFFDDAFSMLVGDRPDFAAAAAAIAATPSAGPGAGEASDDDDYRWSRWISTDTLETEIKRQAQSVAAVVRSSTSFKGGGYLDARDAFSTLAVMFAVSAAHDEDARWADRAKSLAALIARAGANCKVGTDNSFREASARSEDLAELVRGGRPDTPAASEEDDWSTLADRAPLMRRLDVALFEQLGPLTANERAFERGAEDALHQAEVLAALSEVLTFEGFIDAGDEDYDAFARNLRDAAADIARAADQEDYTPVREAFGRASKACNECHELYRG